MYIRLITINKHVACECWEQRRLGLFKQSIFKSCLRSDVHDTFWNKRLSSYFFKFFYFLWNQSFLVRLTDTLSNSSNKEWTYTKLCIPHLTVQTRLTHRPPLPVETPTFPMSSCRKQKGHRYDNNNTSMESRHVRLAEGWFSSGQMSYSETRVKQRNTTTSTTLSLRLPQEQINVRAHTQNLRNRANFPQKVPVEKSRLATLATHTRTHTHMRIVLCFCSICVVLLPRLCRVVLLPRLLFLNTALFHLIQTRSRRSLEKSSGFPGMGMMF